MAKKRSVIPVKLNGVEGDYAVVEDKTSYGETPIAVVAPRNSLYELMKITCPNCAANNGQRVESRRFVTVNGRMALLCEADKDHLKTRSCRRILDGEAI